MAPNQTLLAKPRLEFCGPPASVQRAVDLTPATESGNRSTSAQARVDLVEGGRTGAELHFGQGVERRVDGPQMVVEIF